MILIDIMLFLLVSACHLEFQMFIHPVHPQNISANNFNCVFACDNLSRGSQVPIIKILEECDFFRLEVVANSLVPVLYLK